MPIPIESLPPAGRIIRQARFDKSLTLDNVGKALGVGRTTAERLEIIPALPPAQRFRDVCELLDISDIELLVAYGYLKKKGPEFYKYIINSLLEKWTGAVKIDALKGTSTASCIELMRLFPGLVFKHNGVTLKLEKDSDE